MQTQETDKWASSLMACSCKMACTDGVWVVTGNPCDYCKAWDASIRTNSRDPLIDLKNKLAGTAEPAKADGKHDHGEKEAGS